MRTLGIVLSAVLRVGTRVFRENGVDAEIVTVTGASGGTAGALAANAIEVGCVSMGPLANGYLRGLKFRILAAGGIYTSASPTTSLLVRKASSFQGARDLNGKVFGQPVLKDLIHVATLKWLDANGGDSRTISVIELPMSGGSGQLANNRIDAYPQIEPFLTAAFETGDFRSLGNVYDAIANRVMLSVNIASADWLDKNPVTARNVALSLHQAADWANGNRADANAILERVTKLPGATIAKMHHVVQGTSIEVSTLQPTVDAMAQYNFIDRHFSISEIL